MEELLKSKVDLIVLGISSKGIEWISDQLSQIYKDENIPNLLMLTKGLSIHENKYELLVDKLERLLTDKGIKKINISAVGGPCLAAGLANRVHSSVVIANKQIKTAKQIADMLNTNYYHTSHSDDLNGVEVSAAIKNIFSMAVGAAKGLCSKNISDKVREKNYLNTALALIIPSIKGNFFLLKSSFTLFAISFARSAPSTVTFSILVFLASEKVSPSPIYDPIFAFLPPPELTYKSPNPAKPFTVSFLPFKCSTKISIS